MRFNGTIHLTIEAKNEDLADELLGQLVKQIKELDNRVLDVGADVAEPIEDEPRDEEYERAAARARLNDFEKTGGKDWT